MLSFLRAPAPPRRTSARDNPVYYENNTSWQKFHPKSSRYFTTHCIPSASSFINPPPHLHLYQDEEFRVAKGRGIWRLPTQGKETVKSEGETIWLPRGVFHQFENPSPEEELIVDIRIEPETTPRGVEESFFRNFFGYLDDCRAAKTAPSLFQLELFLSTVDGPLAIPIPGPDWLKWWVSRIVCLVLGVVVGEWLLGYRRSYPEYYLDEYAQLD